MPGYVSMLTMDALKRCSPRSYHCSTKCGFLVKPGEAFVELTDEFIEQQGKYLKPCQRCHPKVPKPKEVWPRAEQITIWVCSDGNEFTTEVDALRHELEVFRNG